MVRSILDSRRFSPLRLSVAGRGLPERMRTTAFAFLGLTAAAALAVVAMLAQAGWPVLLPGPLPSAPAREVSVAEAVTLGHSSGPAVRHRIAGTEQSGQTSAAPIQEGGPAAGGAGGSTPAAVESPAPVSGSEPGGGEEGAGGAPAGTPADAPPPVATPASPAVPASPPASTPEPEATTSVSAPTGPGSSSSAAAAEHASERGVEASSGNGNGNAYGKVGK